MVNKARCTIRADAKGDQIIFNASLCQGIKMVAVIGYLEGIERYLKRSVPTLSFVYEYEFLETWGCPAYQ
jgi:hypothetical protein